MVTLQQIKRLFKLKKTKATAVVDRLVRHSETLELNMPGCRMEQAKASPEASVCAVVMITDSYLRLLRGLRGIQSMVERLSKADADFSPRTRIDLSRIVFNEVASALDAAQKMHAMLLTQRQDGFNSTKESRRLGLGVELTSGRI